MKLKLVVCVPSLWCPFLPVLCHRRLPAPPAPWWELWGVFLMNRWHLWPVPVGLFDCHSVHGLKSGLPVVVQLPWSGHLLILFLLLQPQSKLQQFLRASAKDIWLCGGDRLLVWWWQSEENQISFLLCFYPPAQPGLPFMIGVLSGLCIDFVFWERLKIKPLQATFTGSSNSESICWWIMQYWPSSLQHRMVFFLSLVCIEGTHP